MSLQSELLRIVRTPDNNILVDLTGKLNGKGAYIKKDSIVVDKAKKSKILDRMLDTTIPDSIYEEINEIINK